MLNDIEDRINYAIENLICTSLYNKHLDFSVGDGGEN